jgi:ATP/ADP translocase
MVIERIVMIFAGLVVLAGLMANNMTGNVNWLWLSALPAIMLIVTGFTRFCPMAFILGKTNLKSGPVFYSSCTKDDCCSK